MDSSAGYRHLVLTTAMLCSLSICALSQENLVSRPVGFVRVEVAPGEQKLLSLPFHAMDSGIDAVLGGQLTGGTNGTEADTVFKWNAVEQLYVAAMKVDRTAQTNLNGRWVADLPSGTLSDLELVPGEGFWVANRQGVTQSVFLAGELILDPTNTVVFVPNLNLFGYPYSVNTDIDETQLPEKKSGLIVDSLTSNGRTKRLKMGEGYWYRRLAESNLVWAEVRPYADVFPADDAPPRVSAIKRVEAGMELVVECSGAEGERIDIFYKDVSDADRFDSTTGWLLALGNIASGGDAVLVWTDQGSDTRASVDHIGGRYYMAARADIDADLDGVPDARQRFLADPGPHTPPPAATAGAVIPGDVKDEQALPAVLGSGEAKSNGREQGPKSSGAGRGRMIHVDCRLGDDAFTGRSRHVSAGNGPKRTIRAARRAAESGDTIVIHAGTYRESLSIVGHSVKVVIEGKVRFN